MEKQTMNERFYTGLVSVSFRPLGVEEIIRLCVENGLDGVEWGGDIHVPAGDVERAQRVGEMTRAAGLRVLAYGSYYRVGTYGEGAAAEFAAVLASAKALGAPLIRVWPGKTSPKDTDEATYLTIVADTQAICDAAAAEGLTVVFECHNNTLTEDYPSTLRYLQDVDRPNAQMYWQPNQFRDEAYNLEALEALRPWVTNLHTFHWIGKERFPLAQGVSIWQAYRDRVTDDRPHGFLLEFMPDDKPETLPEEVRALREILD
jgi:sugar phosphate isomerase/epimerase